MKIKAYGGITIFIFSLMLLNGSLSSCSTQEEKLYRKSAVIMDTLFSITVSSDSEAQAEQAINQAFEDIKELEGLISFWSDKSEIYDINKAAGISGVRVSPLTLDMTEKALFVSEKTNGAFDATIGPLIRLYDFKKKTMPGKDIIKKTLPLVNYKGLVIDKDRSTAFLRKKGMSFDTGGIAKGYAADMAVRVLKSKGIKAGIVAIAGDIKTFGLKPDGKPWLIGIRNPRPENKDDDIMATIGLSDEAVSTSGDYERYFMEDGIRYHHILNPKTGMSAEGCQSVTIIAKEGAFADGFSTGIFVMGVRDGMRLIKDMGFEGIIVDKGGQIHITDGIKNRVRFKDKYENQMSHM